MYNSHNVNITGIVVNWTIICIIIVCQNICFTVPKLTDVRMVVNKLTGQHHEGWGYAFFPSLKLAKQFCDEAADTTIGGRRLCLGIPTEVILLSWVLAVVILLAWVRAEVILLAWVFAEVYCFLGFLRRWYCLLMFLQRWYCLLMFLQMWYCLLMSIQWKYSCLRCLQR